MYRPVHTYTGITKNSYVDYIGFYTGINDIK